MGVSATVLAAVSAGAAVAGTAMSYINQQKAAEAQQQAERARARSAQEEAMQARIMQAREERKARASMEQSAVNFGIGMDTSSVSGAISSGASQMGSNIGRINVQEDFARIASTSYARASSYNSRAQGWQSFATLAGKAFNTFAPNINFGQAGTQAGNTSTNTIFAIP